MSQMKYRQPGYLHCRSRAVRAMQAMQDYGMEKPLHGRDHYFVIFTMGLDMCARCRKPRSEHPRAK